MAKRKRKIDPLDHGWPLQFGFGAGVFCYGFGMYALIIGAVAGDDDGFFRSFAQWVFIIGGVVCALALVYGVWLLWVTLPWRKENSDG